MALHLAYTGQFFPMKLKPCIVQTCQFSLCRRETLNFNPLLLASQLVNNFSRIFFVCFQILGFSLHNKFSFHLPQVFCKKYGSRIILQHFFCENDHQTSVDTKNDINLQSCIKDSFVFHYRTCISIFTFFLNLHGFQFINHV